MAANRIAIETQGGTMSTALEYLQNRRRREAELPSGLKVAYHLPDVEECVIQVGQVPIVALQAAQKPTEEEAMAMVATLAADDPEAMPSMLRLRTLLVATMLDSVDGIEVDDDR